jgi:hypothetical protein
MTEVLKNPKYDYQLFVLFLVMKSIKYVFGMFALAVTMTYMSCSATKHARQKPADLSDENVNLETLLLNRPNARTVLTSRIPDSDENGDSMIFEYKGSHLILKERYFGNNPDDLMFSEKIYRNPEGFIDSITTTTRDSPRSFLKHSSNLFYNTTDTNAKKVDEKVKVYHFRYDVHRKRYYLDEKADKPK